MKEFKISGYLYLPLGTTESEVNDILNNRFDNLNINAIEDREHEVAVDFDIIVEKNSKEEAEGYLLQVMNNFDVDNYVITQN